METNYIGLLEERDWENNTNEVISKVLKREVFVIPTKVGIQSFLYVATISGFPFARE